jgi:hypothetical protein
MKRRREEPWKKEGRKAKNQYIFNAMTYTYVGTESFNYTTI